MARSGRFNAARERSIGDLGRDFVWLWLHSAASLGLLAVALAGITLTHPDPAAVGPKLAGTVLAGVVPLVGGTVLGWMWARDPRCWPGRFCWLAGLLLLAAMSVWVLGMPTGPGMCDGCGTKQKLVRTFFSFERGSGLMGGDGLLVGCWAPLAMVSYSAGIGLGLRLERY